jgi:dihydrofolate reductase
MIKDFTITGIAARNQQNILGIGGKMPWGKITGDLEFYKQQTLNKTVVCGGNTYRSLPKSALKNRQTIVFSRSIPDVIPDNVHFIDHLICPGFFIEDIAHLAISNEIMIAGGGFIYNFFQHQYDKFYLTEISGPDFDTTQDDVVYFDVDLNSRGKNLNWTTKIYDWFIEHNNVGSFDVKILEMGL